MTSEPIDAPLSKKDSPVSEAPPGTGRRSPKRRGWLGLLALGVAGAAVYFAYPLLSPGRSGSVAPPAEAPAARVVPVVAEAARTGDMNIYLMGLGTVTALNTVTIRSRVDGQLDKVAFVEGQLLHEGDLLFEIDPRPFLVQLSQAEGQLAKDEAALKNAKLDLERNEQAKDAISAQQLATQAALVAQLEGVVKSDRAQVDNANLLLGYSRIKTPLTGRIGLRLVDQGNMVRASDSNGLAVITQVQPISVVFSLPQDTIKQVVGKMGSGTSLVVEAYDRDLKTQLATGSLLALDNQVDPSTGTVRLKSLFANEDNALFPSQFVNARLLVDAKRGTVIVPSAALQRTSLSTFVYVVKADNTVEVRPVVAGPSEGAETSVERGLSPGEVVVTDGLDKLQKGTRVTVRRDKAPDTKGSR
jgi:membrane fusion protein, multidrug efflux system